MSSPHLTSGRLVRITVVTPQGDVDLAVSTDTAAVDLVRLVLTGASAADDSVALHGWEVVHPTRGPLSADRPLGSLGTDLRDGGVLVLRPREPADTSPPVDDLAEHVREVTGTFRAGLSLVVLTVLTVLVAPASAVFMGSAPTARLVVAVTGGILALLLPVVTRHRPAVGVPLGVACVSAVGTSVGIVAAGRGGSAIVVATAVVAGVGIAALVLATTTRGRWWRPLALAASVYVVVGALDTAGTALEVDAARREAVALVAVLVVLAAAPPWSLLTSGLAGVDDRLAAGRHVAEAEATAAVRRASDDLAALTGAAVSVVVPVAGAAGASGAAGVALALTVGLVVATRARSMVRAVHVVPMVLGGCLAVVVALVAFTSAEHPRLTPVVVAGLILLVGASALAAERGLTPVAVGRWRTAADAVARVGVLLVPLLVAGVFDLYRLIWERF